MKATQQRGISRRQFLVGSAAVAAGALLAQKGWVDAQAFVGPDGIDVDGLERAGYRVRHTICHQCGAGCGLTALLKGRGNAAVSEEDILVLPNQHPDHPQRGYCGRGATAMFTWNSPLRLRKPLKLVGPRGSGEFQEISWDQALDEIAAKLREIVERDGARSVAMTTHDFGTETNWLAWGLETPNMIGQASTCNTAGVVGRRWMMGSAYQHHAMIDPDYENLRYVLFPGRSMAAPIGAVHNLAKAREHGAKVVFLNPAHPDVAFADGEWISCKPATDAAFMLGVANVLVSEGRFDEHFVRNYTNLPFLLTDDGHMLTAADLEGDGEDDRFAVWDDVSEALAFHDDEDVRPDMAFEGNVELADGSEVHVTTAWNRLVAHLRDYTPGRAAEITGVPAATITRVARELHTMQGVVEDTWYNTRNGNDTDAIMGLMTVNGLLGNLDRPGGMCFRPGTRLPGIMSRAGDGTVTTILGGELATNPGRRIDQMLYPETNGTFEAIVKGILDEEPYAINALVMVGATLFHRDPNTKRIEEALRKLELVVNVDIVHQEVCDWSDYVLPSDMFLERDRLSNVGWTRTATVAKAERVTSPPPGVDARPNEWIMLEILRRAYPERAEALGYHEGLKEPSTFYTEFQKRIEDARLERLAEAWERDVDDVRAEFKRNGFITFRGIQYGSIPYNTPLATPSGRLEIWASRPVTNGWREHGFAYHFDPPAYTMPTGANDFYLVNGKSPIGSSGVSSLAFPTQYLVDNALWIHPSDAERLGISDGDTVEVTGLDTGWVATTEARVTPRVHPGVAFTYSYTGGNRQGVVRDDPRFAKIGTGINPQWFSTAWIDPVTGSNHNNASVRIRRA
ncbi:MAG: twin-arginine translocation signal domain-containing protein [Trueperaceae bacterium]|nr:MAG: twin-arginine translocation signal domain-containing protein [Trueperaceae bacterium]